MSHVGSWLVEIGGAFRDPGIHLSFELAVTPACLPDTSWALINAETYVWPTKNHKWLTFDENSAQKWVASRPNFTDQDCISLAMKDPVGAMSFVTTEKGVLGELAELSGDHEDTTEIMVNPRMPQRPFNDTAVALRDERMSVTGLVHKGEVYLKAF